MITKRKLLPAFFILAMAMFFISADDLFSAPLQVAAQDISKASPNPAHKTPKSFYPGKRHEFEAVMEGVEIKHDFIVENRGGAPLVIKSVRPD